MVAEHHLSIDPNLAHHHHLLHHQEIVSVRLRTVVDRLRMRVSQLHGKVSYRVVEVVRQRIAVRKIEFERGNHSYLPEEGMNH